VKGGTIPVEEQQGERPAGRVVFVGAVHEATSALGALLSGPAEVAEVVTLPAGRAGAVSGYVDLEPLASAHGVPVWRCADLNAPESVEHVRRLRPDLIVVAGWTRLLSAELLAVPRRGCVGFHASLLPRYRGRAPVNWAILRGETVTGNTMMYLDAGADTGDIIDQRPVPIRPDDTCATVYARVAEAGAYMLRRHLPALLGGTAPRRPQGPADGPPLVKRTPRMGITDFSRAARAVHDWIRALTEPYPGAFTFWNGRKVMLWASAEPAEAPGAGGRGGHGEPGVRGGPGEVLGSGPRGLLVGTADGSVLVTAMSDPGAPPEPAGEWARRNGLRAGDRFDAVDRATSDWVLGLAPEPPATPALCAGAR
jgi:methionyl-tRNA formyltransferase